MMRIALTGGIACGKSAAGQILTKLGAAVIDLDDIAQEVIMPHTDGLSELVSAFGEQILNADKSLNRPALGEILLKSQANQQRIEAILHPKIFAQMQMQIDQLNAQLVWVEVPRLTKHNRTFFDRAVIVNCTKKKQLERLMQRDNISAQQAEAKIVAQQLDYSDLTLPININNDSTKKLLSQQVIKLHENLTNL